MSRICIIVVNFYSIKIYGENFNTVYFSFIAGGVELWEGNGIIE